MFISHLLSRCLNEAQRVLLELSRLDVVTSNIPIHTPNLGDIWKLTANLVARAMWMH